MNGSERGLHGQDDHNTKTDTEQHAIGLGFTPDYLPLQRAAATVKPLQLVNELPYARDGRTLGVIGETPFKPSRQRQ